MAKFEIRATYEYWAEGIEADSQEEAERIFLQDLNDHYYGTESFEVTEIEVCEDCGEDLDDCECEDAE